MLVGQFGALSRAYRLEPDKCNDYRETNIFN
jgi:hypothetical protein